MNDYDRIARAIRYLDAHHTEQPDLATLAQSVGLSPFHFHRLFASWAGVTPKDFLQCLTLAHARELLQRGEQVLEAALQTGLSGPGRLHDLCVSLEAASPGELKSGGAGQRIVSGLVDTPFGACLIAETARGICHVAFVDSGNESSAWAELEQHWPRAQLRRDDSRMTTLGRRIFTRPRERSAQSSFRAYVRGSAFQVGVWRALLRIEPGTVVSYGRLAAALGQPAAARAVGSAVAQNPLAYLIPCHRVIRETGVIGQYHWGTERKRVMLAWESAPQSASAIPDPVI